MTRPEPLHWGQASPSFTPFPSQTLHATICGGIVRSRLGLNFSTMAGCDASGCFTCLLLNLSKMLFIRFWVFIVLLSIQLSRPPSDVCSLYTRGNPVWRAPRNHPLPRTSRCRGNNCRGSRRTRPVRQDTLSGRAAAGSIARVVACSCLCHS